MVAPVSVAESWTAVPMATPVPDSWVLMLGAFGLTTNCSLVQGLVAGLLFASPL